MSDTTVETEAPWYEYIDRKRRHNFLAILETLSRQQNKDTPQFFLIGAMALVMQNYLRYQAWWDIDLLFRDEESLLSFAKNIKAPGLNIIQLDDEIIITSEIKSWHSMWSFGRTWANVDYIYRPERFQFFYETICDREPFSEIINVDNREYHIDLLLGDPWDIFVDKLTLQRVIDQLQRGDCMGKDFRHIDLILRHDHDNPDFWQHVMTKAEELDRKEVLCASLLRLAEIAPEAGYTQIRIPEEIAGSLHDSKVAVP